jgi:hypothetical protein
VGRLKEVWTASTRSEGLNTGLPPSLPPSPPPLQLASPQKKVCMWEWWTSASAPSPPQTKPSRRSMLRASRLRRPSRFLPPLSEAKWAVRKAREVSKYRALSPTTPLFGTRSQPPMTSLPVARRVRVAWWREKVPAEGGGEGGGEGGVGEGHAPCRALVSPFSPSALPPALPSALPPAITCHVRGPDEEEEAHVAVQHHRVPDLVLVEGVEGGT